MSLREPNHLSIEVIDLGGLFSVEILKGARPSPGVDPHHPRGKPSKQPRREAERALDQPGGENTDSRHRVPGRGEGEPPLPDALGETPSSIGVSQGLDDREPGGGANPVVQVEQQFAGLNRLNIVAEGEGLS